MCDGYDASFTTDMTRIQRLRVTNYSDTPKLLRGFFNFYADFDFNYYAICPRVGKAFPVLKLEEHCPLPEGQVFRVGIIGRVRIRCNQLFFEDRSGLDENFDVRYFFQTHVVHVQDPFVLDHNIAVTMNKATWELMVRVLRSCQLACLQVRAKTRACAQLHVWGPDDETLTL